ncbi:MAG: EamA family transporter [Lautropia sp.]
MPPAVDLMLADAVPGWWWIAFTLVAAGAQTARNAMQKRLTARLGTLGATHVRFLYGLPFATLSLLGLALATGASVPTPDAAFAGWVALGASSQIAATALMLAAMKEKHFVVATAYIKTEPVQVALFALVFLSERLGFAETAAIAIATAGVVVMSWPSRKPGAETGADGVARASGDLRALMLGLAAGAAFAVSAVGFKGAIVSLGQTPFTMAATATLVSGLVLQVLLLSAWLAWRSPTVLRDVFRAWRPSLAAGFMGALASQMWFLGFALTSTAHVRTLGLVEILFAQIVSRSWLRQRLSAREAIGICLVAAGVLLLLQAASAAG